MTHQSPILHLLAVAHAPIQSMHNRMDAMPQSAIRVSLINIRVASVRFTLPTLRIILDYILHKPEESRQSELVESRPFAQVYVYRL